MSKLDKIIFYILEKLEFRLSKKEHKVSKRDNISDRLAMYRSIIDCIDDYRIKINPETMILRHYRYINFEIDELK